MTVLSDKLVTTSGGGDKVVTCPTMRATGDVGVCNP